jgi:hypothetical protein
MPDEWLGIFQSSVTLRSDLSRPADECFRSIAVDNWQNCNVWPTLHLCFLSTAWDWNNSLSRQEKSERNATVLWFLVSLLSVRFYPPFCLRHFDADFNFLKSFEGFFELNVAQETKILREKTTKIFICLRCPTVSLLDTKRTRWIVMVSSGYLWIRLTCIKRLRWIIMVGVRYLICGYTKHVPRDD